MGQEGNNRRSDKLQKKQKKWINSPHPFLAFLLGFVVVYMKRTCSLLFIAFAWDYNCSQHLKNYDYCWCVFVLEIRKNMGVCLPAC